MSMLLTRMQGHNPFLYRVVRVSSRNFVWGGGGGGGGGGA